MKSLPIVLTFFILVACSTEIEVSPAQVQDAIKKSDGFNSYSDVFVTETTKLVKNGKCTLNELAEQGGWMKSTLNYSAEPVYFTYCGGMHRSNRVYLNVITQKVFTD